MPKNASGLLIASIVLLQFVATSKIAQAQDHKTLYPAMAPVEQYLMADESAEIELARSAAPQSISDAAEVMVLGAKGYKTAVKGSNGFVCVVQRSWTAPIDDPNFWNPKLRGPTCFNATAARTYLPIVLIKSKLILAGKTNTEMFQAVTSALDKKELPAQEPGAMCYMMSKQQYLDDEARNWHPHLMFFVPIAAKQDWGADLPGSPVLKAEDPEDRLVIFMVPVRRWSDGTEDLPSHK